jgi:hypothetical protein
VRITGQLLAKAAAYVAGGLVSLWAVDEGSTLLAEELEPEDGGDETIQTGGRTIEASTAEKLGLTREQAKRAMERLKADVGQGSADHSHRIKANGDVYDSNTGEYLGNLHSYK